MLADAERLLPILHSKDIEFVRTSFLCFLPRSLSDCLNGHLKLQSWRAYQDKRIAPKPKLDIKRHLFTSNEAPQGSMLQILGLDFVVRIEDMGMM